MGNKPTATIHASTQDFIEIDDIRDDVVLLRNGTACLVIEVQAVNFSLLSQEEQSAKVYAYASLLNSLSFPIEVLIRNKRVDISTYLKLLDQEISNAANERISTYITMYKGFVQELVKVNTVLDKKFYIIIPYSSLEHGTGGAVQKGSSYAETFFANAKQSLQSKADTLHQQIGRLNLRAKTLDKEGLVKLFYDEYNRDASQIQESSGIQTPMVKGQQ